MDNSKLHGGLQAQDHVGVTWLDVQNPSDTVLAELQQKYKLHPIHLKESSQKVQHDQVEHEKDYLFLVMHYPVAAERRGHKVAFGQVGIFLGKNFLITIRTAPSNAVADLFAECTHPDQGKLHFKHGSGYVLYLMIGRMLDEIARMTDVVTAELDTIEDVVFDNNTSDAFRIGKVRQKIVRLSRIIGPKRILLQDLADRIDATTHKNMAKYYANNTKTANRLWGAIQEAQDTIEIYKDVDFTTSTEQTNEILAVLTILFTITIPITVVGTVYGMNIHLPGGLQAGSWDFFGPYSTFVTLVGISLLFALSMLLYFRHKKWF